MADTKTQITNITFTDTTGFYDKTGRYAAGHSKIRCDFTIVPGTTNGVKDTFNVVEYTLGWDTEQCNSSDFLNSHKWLFWEYGKYTSQTNWSFVFSHDDAHDVTLTIDVIDQNNVTTTATPITITFSTYSSPQISISGYRCDASGIEQDDGAYANFTIDATPDADLENNTTTVALKYKDRSTNITDWTTVDLGTITSAQTFTQQISVAEDLAYDVQAVITDMVTSVTASMTLSTAAVPLDFLKGGKGIAIGKTATREGLDIAFPTYVEGDKLYVDGKTILDKFFPIGKLWISEDPTSPASIVGGSWEQLEAGRTIVAAGTGYAAGSTGGEATHKLTASEMPAHTHDNGAGIMWKATTNSNSPIATPWGQKAALYHESYNSTGSTGGNRSHNNMMPYRAEYMWRRIA